MPTEHHDSKSGVTTSVEPATLINVKIVEIEKIIEVPKFKDVEVDKPIFVEKKYERPVIINKEYERPVIKDREYEKPVIKEKEVVVEIPVPVEKPYDMPKPVEVPYDIPMVSITQVNDLASQAVSTLKEAKDMLKKINAGIMLLSDVIANVKETIPEEIKLPKIIEKEIIVETPTFVTKEYEVPVVKEVEYEKPIVIERKYEKPVITEIECEKPIITIKEYEVPVIVEKEYERPVITEKEYEIPVPVEVSYDVPLVSAEKVAQIASETENTVIKSQETLDDLNKAIDKAKVRIPEELKETKIIHEEVIVKDVKIVEETIHVIGRVIAKDG